MTGLSSQNPNKVQTLTPKKEAQMKTPLINRPADGMFTKYTFWDRSDIWWPFQ